MARPRTRHRCQACGHTSPRWLGRCPDCGAWGTVAEEAAPTPAPAATAPAAPTRQAVPIADVPSDARGRVETGMPEFDRVLGGGFVPGSVTLVGGEPGAGKSTLLLQVAAEVARRSHPVLYVSAEESPAQVRLRATRIGALDAGVLLAAETEVPAILGHLERESPALLVIDSIQTVRVPDVPGIAGGVAQVRDSAQALVTAAKDAEVATVLVGHVTKEGQLAGPRVLEHLVDAVCDLSGDRHHALRLLRATKNRFGATGEVGCFEMRDAGLVGVDDAGRLFVGDATGEVAGVALTLVLEGSRPLACEVQALVAPTALANPRRVASGLDGQRLALLVAVLGQRAGIALGGHDVYASSVGGLRLAEPAVDLALCLAIASSRQARPVAPGLVAVAEVGLAGELRQATGTERRLAEAARLGFRAAIVPHAYDGPGAGLDVHRARTLADALAVGLGAPDVARRREGGGRR